MSRHQKTLGDAGERTFITRIRKMMPADGGTFRRSVGDDCLVTEPLGNDAVLATTDTFVDGVHFGVDYMSYENAGRRCMTASVSDIAAMAGVPVCSLVSLSMPKDFLFDDAVSLFTGLRDAAAEYRCPVTGGETTSTPGPVTITVTVLGTAAPGSAVLRSGAQAGDRIFVTGTVGDAMAGLEAFQRGEDGFDTLKAKFVSPTAHVKLARALVSSYHITAMIDISDGLAVDLGHMCDESHCGAEIHAPLIPLSGEFRRFAEKLAPGMIEFALSSGEEFELLFTSGDRQIPDRFTLNDRTVTGIGTIVGAEKGMNVYGEDETPKPLLPRGYEHFKS